MTWKKTFGHHPLVAFVDHGQAGSGEPVAALLRPGVWVAEITDIPDLSTWPKGMRLIVRRERPHPGAQLRFTGLDGLRLTCFATHALTHHRTVTHPAT